MGLCDWLRMSAEERRAAREERTKRDRANADISRLIHSTALSDTQYGGIQTLIQDRGNIRMEAGGKGYAGITLLHLAAMNGCRNIVSLLIENGADINGVAFEGATPLILASQCGHVEVVHTLLEANADVSRLMSFNMDCYFPQLRGRQFTALEIARLHGNSDVATLLEEHGTLAPSQRSRCRTIRTVHTFIL